MKTEQQLLDEFDRIRGTLSLEQQDTIQYVSKKAALAFLAGIDFDPKEAEKDPEGFAKEFAHELSCYNFATMITAIGIERGVLKREDLVK